MIPVTTFAGRRIAVFGLGGSGMTAAHALAAGGAEIAVFDDDRARCEAAWNEGLPVGDLRVADFTGFDALVLSPGVPLTHPAPHWTVRKAAEAGIEIIGDIELFDRERRAVFPSVRLLAVTGTNGKSTTTALAAHLLAAAGRAVAVGGNIGAPALGLEVPAPDGVVVLECSSFQIDLTRTLRPDVGVHLNLSADHLDRHGTMANYAAVKERLVAKSAVAVVGADDAMSAAIGARLAFAGKPVLSVSARGPVGDGVAAEGTRLVRYRQGQGEAIGDLAGIPSLRGAHNGQNAAAAVAALLALGLAPEAATAGLCSFPGLPHRLEQVADRNGVLFLNDSKATNAESARQALAAFDDVLWIAGGRAKEGGITGLSDLFPRIRKAYLIGESANDFARTLEGQAPYLVSGTLEAAVAAAARDAAEAVRSEGKAPVVLLSPACASYDQFRNFEARGEVFRAAVLAATDDRTSGGS